MQYLEVCQIIINLSSPPDARDFPLLDHLTQFTHATKRVENKCTSKMNLFSIIYEHVSQYEVLK